MRYSLKKIQTTLGIDNNADANEMLEIDEVIKLLAKAVEQEGVKEKLKERCLFDFEERGETVKVRPIVKCDAFLKRAIETKTIDEEIECLESLTVPEEVVTGTEYQQKYLRGCLCHITDDEEKRPKVNRTILKKLASLTKETVSADFSGHILGPYGSIPLISALAGHPSLTTLDLSWNDLREETLPALTSLVASTPHLTSLSLASNRYLAATAGRVLLLIVKQNKNITEMDITGCNIPVYHAKKMSAMFFLRSVMGVK
eukprot:TRINITY_DN12813_c0_g1_i1.p1 TRINITY_DN12813_c0_g1~~TRINITY_DN12813_c0_g1_i1.p1  ORF type:complete len:274 (+),score=74.53 TRINITY_DN12813_c0_g1_i1:51-824(+)